MYIYNMYNMNLLELWKLIHSDSSESPCTLGRVSHFSPVGGITGLSIGEGATSSVIWGHHSFCLTARGHRWSGCFSGPSRT